MKNKQRSEAGRTMLEMLAILCLIALLSYLGVKGFDRMMNRSKSQAIEKSIKTLVFERQASPNALLSAQQMVKGPYGELYIGRGTGNKEQFFYVETSALSLGLCEQLLDSHLIQPDVVTVNGVDDALCAENDTNIIRFYFDYSTGSKPTWTDNRGIVHNCNRGAAGCDKTGSTTSCKAGLYLSGGNCLSCPEHMVTCQNENTATSCVNGYYLYGGSCEECPEHVATCQDANTPISCESGYLLYDKKCISTTCSSDIDCHTACASCVSGTCTNECNLNQCDASNPCLEYDFATQTCKYVCMKLEYLQSTGGGSQRIDTGIDGSNNNLEIEIKFNLLGYNQWGGLFGNYKDENTNVWRIIQVNTNNTNMYVYPNTKAGGGNAKTITITKNAVHTIRYNRTSITIDGTNYSYGTLSNGNTNTDSTKKYIQLFRAGLPSVTSYLRIYSFKIWNSGTLVRDFVPVLDKNNTPAMFDKANNVLYYTPSGTFGYGSL